VKPEPDECYLNLGDGRFEPAAQRLGLFGEGNRGLGAVIADFNNDRRPEIYVANDTTPNFLFIADTKKGSQSEGTTPPQEGADLPSGTAELHFVNQAMLQGCAVNADGVPQASMGIACGDFDRNGWLDLYLTHFTNEWNTLYANLGPQGFMDQTAVVNLVVPTHPMLAFGTTMCDFNGDGWYEIYVANGHINPRRTEGTGYEMPPQLFSFNGVSWDDIGVSSGEHFQRRQVGRAVATADFDRDGRTDVIVVNQNSPAALLHNRSAGSRLLQLDLVGRSSNRQAVGTRVSTTIDGTIRMAERYGGGGYCSSDEPLISLGFGEGVETVDLQVDWPNGTTQHLKDVRVPSRRTLIEPVDGVEESPQNR
jgi:hypothetical protein